MVHFERTLAIIGRLFPKKLRADIAAELEREGSRLAAAGDIYGARRKRK